MTRVIRDEHEALQHVAERLKERGINIEMRADGEYDAAHAFSLLSKLEITPIIRIRSNSNARASGVDRARGNCVLEWFGGKGGCTNYELNHTMKSERLANQKWKGKRYGLWWIVEIVTSFLKRTFGEAVRARSPRTGSIEIATKIAAYNHNLDIGDDVIRAIRDVRGRTNDGPSWSDVEVTCLYEVAA